MFRTVACLVLMLALAAGGCLGGSGTKEGSYREGLRLLKAQDPGSAVISFKNALEKDQNYFEARLQLGRAYAALGKYDAAEKELRKALLLAPGSTEAGKELARACALGGRGDEALKAVERLPMQSDPEIREIAGWAYALKGDHASAIALLRKAAESGERGRASARVLLAKTYLMIDRTSDALTELRTVLEADPADRQALTLVAEVQLRQKDREGALKTYDALLTQAPGSLPILLRKGLLLIDLKRAEESLELAGAVVKRQPNAAEAYELKGRAHYALGDHASAIVALQKALSLRATAQTHYLLGLCHLAGNELEQAMNQMQRALALEPRSAGPRLVAALIHLKKNKADEAAAEAEKVLAADSGNALAHSLLGSAYLSKGLSTEGVSELDRALALDPGMVDARVKKAAFALSRERHAGAEAELSAAVSAGPELTGSRVLLASFYLRENQPARAAEAARAGLRNKRTDAVLYNVIAEAGLRQLKFDDAAAALEKARAADPEYAATYFKLAALRLLVGDLDGARELATGFARSASGNAAAQLLAARILELSGRERDAESFHDRALRTGAVEAAREVSLRHARRGRPGEALTVLDDALRKHPGDAGLLAMKADIARSCGRFDEALQASEELAGQGRVGLQPVIETYLAMGRTDKALERVRQEMTRGAKRLDLRAGISRIELHAGRHKEAEENARSMVRDEPGAALSYLTLASLQQAAGKPDRAVETLRSAPVANSARLALALGGLYQARKNYPAALREFTKAGRLQPASPLPALAKAGVLQSMGRRGQAAAEYRGILRRFPDHVPSLNNLAMVLADDPSTAAEAQPFAVRATLLAPGDPAVLDTLGQVLLKNGKGTAGLLALKQAALYAPDDASINYHLALAFIAGKDHGPALSSLEKAVKRGDFPEATQAKELLARLSSGLTGTGVMR